MSHRSGHTHTTAAQDNRTNPSCSKSVPVPHRKNYFLKFPALLKIFKPTTHSRHENSWTETAKTQTYSDMTITVDRRLAYNSVLPKLAVTWKIEAECSYQTFVQVDSEVLRNHHVRQARNRSAVIVT